MRVFLTYNNRRMMVGVREKVRTFATFCAADIRVSGMEQALRYAVILMDISDESGEDFDELLIERNARGAIWLHFAVRAQGNRRRIR